MKRWIIAAAVMLMLLVPSVCSAGSELRFSADDGARRAELWLDGTLLVRFVIAEAVPTWTREDSEKTIWLSPRIEDGMLRIIVR